MSGFSCVPTVDGRVADTTDSHAYQGISLALPSDWVDQEYFISCSSPTITYKTAVWVRQPGDSKTASHVAVVEALHPSGAFGMRVNAEKYMFERGIVHIGVGATNATIEQKVKPSNPARYASLNVPATPEAQNEILAGVGALLHRDPTALVPGVKVTKTILGGFSATTVIVRDFIDSPAGKATVDGRRVFDGYFPGQGAVGTNGQSQLAPIPAVGVPVVELQGERELLVNLQVYGKIGYRQADAKWYRLYEVPGMPHVPVYPGADCEWPPGAEPLNFDQPAVWETALDNLIRWVARGIPAPRASRIQLAADGKTVVRDAYGNALGGFRTIAADVPAATLTATSFNRGGTFGSPCAYVGYQVPLSATQITTRYKDHTGYVAQVTQRAGQLVRGRWLLPDLAREEISAAKKSDVGTAPGA
jgi:hypothetical protein